MVVSTIHLGAGSLWVLRHEGTGSPLLSVALCVDYPLRRQNTLTASATFVADVLV